MEFMKTAKNEIKKRHVGSSLSKESAAISDKKLIMYSCK